MTSPDTPSGEATTYRIHQLGPPRDREGELVRVHRTGVQLNEPVTGFDSLVLHHPGDNRATRMQDGLFAGGKADRAYGFIGGQLQDVEFHRHVKGEFRTYGLQPDQVLLKKDFILSHPDMDPMSDRGRSVPVPSPVAGVVGARREGMDLWTFLIVREATWSHASAT